MATLEEYLQQQGVAQTKDEFFRDAVRQSANREFELKIALREAYTEIVEHHAYGHEEAFYEIICSFCDCSASEQHLDNMAMTASDIQHKSDCMVLKAKQWLEDNPS